MDFLETSHDIVTYYCFWSLFYGLGPMIWFYPLNELDITGYETFAAVWLIPAITAIRPLRRMLESLGGLLTLTVGMLLGILSFHAPTTWSRLAILSFGNAAAMLLLSLRLFNGTVKARFHHFWMFLTSNYLFLASRVVTQSIVPAWTNDQINLAISLILAVSIVMWLVRALCLPVEKEKLHSGKIKSDWKKLAPEMEGHKASAILSQAGMGVTFGSIIYLTHWVFGELGVLSRWTVRGLPSAGPSPFLASPFVLMALMTGAALPMSFNKLSSSPIIWLAGSLAFLATYFLDAWPGFICGLILAIYTSILWVNVMERVIFAQPGLLMTVAMLTYLGQIFFHVWTVAYNFVPGGIHTREHSDYLIAFMCLAFLGTVKWKNHSPSKNERPSSVMPLLALAFAIALLGTCLRIPVQPKARKVLNPSTRDFSALIWTFHFGYDNQGWPSLRRAADLLNKTNADVIALLESDASKPYLGLNDLGMWLSEELGMFVDFGPATKDHTWGNLLLSKYPIVSSTHHLLPSPYGELAPAICATLNISGNLVDVISTHMGNDRDSIDRDVQTKYLSGISAASANPVVFLGYVTSAPGSRDYNAFTSDGGLKDIDATDKSRFCEYIFYKNLIRQGYARISHGGLSDTELQMARFSIPLNLSSYHDNDLYQLDRAKVDRWKRFPKDFGNHTVGHYYQWKHHYQMSTPKYFVPILN